MSALQGLAGIAQAINGGFEGYNAQEKRKTQVAEEQATREKIDREKRDREALDAANKSFMDIINGVGINGAPNPMGGLSQATPPVPTPAAASPDQAGQQQPGGPSLSSVTSMAPQSAGGAQPAAASAIPPAGKQLGGSNYSDERLYQAYRARTDALARAGLTDHFMDSFSKTSALGARIRQSKMASALARLNSGDASGVADLYGYVNDGRSVESVEPVQQQQGAEPAWRVKVRNHDNGSTSDQVLTRSQLMQGLQSINDYQNALKIEAERAKEIFATDQKIRATDAEVRAKGDQERQTESVKGEEHRKTERVKGEEDRKTEGAKGEQARKTDASKREGEAKAKQTSDEQLHSLVRDVIGEQQNGPLGGTRIGNEDTLRIAGYARALQQADPSMNDLAAVRASVAEFRKRNPAASK